MFIMTLNNVVFIDQYPKLDLHGYDRETARVAILDFIQENKKLKQEIFVIVHGVGSGILRETTKQILSKNKLVLEFKTYYYNSGCTIVRISL
ncbi:MAG: Smr/MutS family protein [Bacilli bacterium]|nr:Smr/MutS family protein [Bacilli bacterium]